MLKSRYLSIIQYSNTKVPTKHRIFLLNLYFNIQENYFLDKYKANPVLHFIILVSVGGGWVVHILFSTYEMAYTNHYQLHIVLSLIHV